SPQTGSLMSMRGVTSTSRGMRMRRSKSSPEDTPKNSNHGRDGNRSPGPRQKTADGRMPLKVHAENGALGAPEDPWSAAGRERHCAKNEAARPYGSRIGNSQVD